MRMSSSIWRHGSGQRSGGTCRSAVGAATRAGVIGGYQQARDSECTLTPWLWGASGPRQSTGRVGDHSPTTPSSRFGGMCRWPMCATPPANCCGEITLLHNSPASRQSADGAPRSPGGPAGILLFTPGRPCAIFAEPFIVRPRGIAMPRRIESNLSRNAPVHA
jgi:hypothetical protein